MPRREREDVAQFAIMKAYHLTSSGRKLGLKKIAKDEPNCTIVVATRHYGYDKKTPCFIIGTRGDYNVKAGDTSSYTIDTGNGYRNVNERLTIEHILHIRDGNIINTEGQATNLEARYTFVMK